MALPSYLPGLGAALLAAAAATLLALGLCRTLLGPLLAASRAAAPGAGPLRGLRALALGRLEVLNRWLLRPRYEALLRRALRRAGAPAGWTPASVLALQEAGAALGLALVLGLLPLLRLPVLLALALPVTGGLLPLAWLRDRARRRQHLIGRALPFHLDLLTLAVEAGLDFTGGLAKVVEKGRPGPLHEELQRVLRGLRMGQTREEALREMAGRVELPALSAFVAALVQADRLGTRLGAVLRLQAHQLRLERSRRAEKLAAVAPVKLLVPLLAFIFPTVFLVLFGPLVFAMMYGGM